jgi:hypothetical protein
MPGGTDLHEVLLRLLDKYNFVSSVDHPKGIIPCTLPSRAPFDLIQGFGTSHMKLAAFHRISRQIVVAAKPDFDSALLSSYSARRLLPSIAELWHIPTEMRNKIGGWSKDEVREVAKTRMPDHYAHFKLDAALQVKAALVSTLAKLCGDLRAATADTTWPNLCALVSCDLGSSVVPQSLPSAIPTAMSSSQIVTSDSSDSSTSTSSESAPGSFKRCDDVVMMPWLHMPAGKVIHSRQGTQPTCGLFIAPASATSGSTMQSAIATGLPLCDRCWRKIDSSVKQLWLGQVAP